MGTSANSLHLGSSNSQHEEVVLVRIDTGDKLAYSVRQAAELLSISRSQMYEMINAGKIGSIKIGRSRRITSRQLNEYLADREKEDA